MENQRIRGKSEKVKDEEEHEKKTEKLDNNKFEIEKQRKKQKGNGMKR